MARASEKNKWALKFSDEMHSWLSERGMSGRQFATLLNIPISRWSDAYAATAITETEYYARIYCVTQLKAADPRTVPPRKVSNDVFIERAWSEEQWQDWCSKNAALYTDGNLGQPTPSSDAPADEDEATPQTFEAELEEAATLGEVISDAASTKQQLQLSIDVLEHFLSADEAEIEVFLQRHRKALGRLYQLLSIFTISDPADRRAAISGLMRFTSRRNS